MGAKFQIGDLVEFSFHYSIGIIMDIRKEPTFEDHEEVYDVLVAWSDGEMFWCMDFTLNHVLSSIN